MILAIMIKKALRRSYEKTKSNVVVGLDIGTTKIVALIAEIAEDQETIILGAGVHASNGLKRGVVVNIRRHSAIDSARYRRG